MLSGKSAGRAAPLIRQTAAMQSVTEVQSRNTWKGAENPFTKNYKKMPAKDFPKQTTGVTGLLVSEYPHRDLETAYKRILRVLGQFPDESTYKKSTAGIINHRLSLVHKCKDITQLEEAIGMGQIEEIIQQAVQELQCARDMLKYQVWQPLVEKAPEDQWRWPV